VQTVRLVPATQFDPRAEQAVAAGMKKLALHARQIVLSAVP
jgi:hypothetical protein